MVTGDLVEQQKPLDGGDWVTSALYLQGISLVRRNNEWHHFDPFGTAGVITNNSAQVLSNDLYDLFGVVRYQQGSAETPWRFTQMSTSEDGLLYGEGVFWLRRDSNAPIVRPLGVPVWLIACAAVCGSILIWRIIHQPRHVGLGSKPPSDSSGK